METHVHQSKMKVESINQSMYGGTEIIYVWGLECDAMRKDMIKYLVHCHTRTAVANQKPF